MIFAFMMVAMLVVVLAVTLLATAWQALRPPRMTDGKAAYLLKRLSPGDLGMAFDVVRFTVPDELTRRPIELAGWWIPHPAGGNRTVVILHGYADAKVGSIAWAPVWRELGFHILAIDSRAHGESSGRFMTAGALERFDVNHLLNQLQTRYPRPTETLFLFGISMGAAIALAAAQMRDGLAGVVLESPYADYRSAMRQHMLGSGLPLVSLLPWTMKLMSFLAGADVESCPPAKIIPLVKCPVFLIQSGNDRFVTAGQSEALAMAMEHRNGQWNDRIWKMDHIEHLMGFTVDPAEYQRNIEQFVAAARPGA